MCCVTVGCVCAPFGSPIMPESSLSNGSEVRDAVTLRSSSMFTSLSQVERKLHCCSYIIEHGFRASPLWGERINDLQNAGTDSIGDIFFVTIGTHGFRVTRISCQWRSER